MTILHYAEGSPLTEVIIRRAEKRAPIAMLTAADPASALPIRAALQAQGWQCVPVIDNGKDMLQVSGFKTEQALQRFLETSGLVHGAARMEAESLDEQKASVGSFLDRFSLWLAGLFNVVGDVSLLGSATKERNQAKSLGNAAKLNTANYKVLAGAAYTLGGANLVLFGAGNPDKAVQDVFERTAEFVQQETGALKDHSALADIAAKRETGTFADAKRFLQKNPAQVTLVPYIIGAAAMLKNGVNKWRSGGGSANMYAGISSVFFKTASFLIPEKQKSDSEDKQTSGSVVDWIREKPLRVFGLGSFVTDVLMGFASRDDYKNKVAGWRWMAVTSGLYLTSDVMMAISRKDPSASKLSADEQLRLEAFAAEAIAAAPDAQRQVLTEKVASFLSDQKEIKGDKASIARALCTQIEHVGRSAWAARADQPAPVQQGI